MIQSQINRNIRLDLADAILLSKAKKDLSFAEIADGTGLAEAFVTAALLGQQALPADAARLVGAKLDLDEDSIIFVTHHTKPLSHLHRIIRNRHALQMQTTGLFLCRVKPGASQQDFRSNSHLVMFKPRRLSVISPLKC